MKKPSKSRGKVPAPISIRLTQEEREAIEIAAAGQPLSAYIRSCALRAITVDNIKEQRLSPKYRQQLLAQLLLKLGSMNLSQSFNELSQAARLGLLDMTPELQAEIKASCHEVQEIRLMILKAMGLRPQSSGAN